MAKKRGNSEFGKNYKHKFDYGREKPLTAQVKAVVYPEIKQQLQELAEKKNCTVPDLLREAIDNYLAQQNECVA